MPVIRFGQHTIEVPSSGGVAVEARSRQSKGHLSDKNRRVDKLNLLSHSEAFGNRLLKFTDRMCLEIIEPRSKSAATHLINSIKNSSARVDALPSIVASAATWNSLAIASFPYRWM
jgi:hypothetical protein